MVAGAEGRAREGVADQARRRRKVTSIMVEAVTF